MQHKDELVAELRQAKYVDVLASYGDSITLIRGWARLKSDHEVAMGDGRVFTAGKIVLATGAKPRILSLTGIEQVETPNIDEKMKGSEKARGWGVFLIESLMDEVTFESKPGGGNVVKMVIHLEK